MSDLIELVWILGTFLLGVYILSKLKSGTLYELVRVILLAVLGGFFALDFAEGLFGFVFIVAMVAFLLIKDHKRNSGF